MYGDPDTDLPVVGLLGRKHDREWDPDLLSSRLQKIPSKILALDPSLQQSQELVVGVLAEERLDNQEINTLDNLLVEISAGNFWILKDLRKKRRRTFDREFMCGKQLIEFNHRLKNLTRPVLPPRYFQKLSEKNEFSNQGI